jgi:hypothetical protein
MAPDASQISTANQMVTAAMEAVEADACSPFRKITADTGGGGDR